MKANNWFRFLVLKDWPIRLTAFFVGLYLLQFVLWISKEDRMWLPETITIVQLSLLCTVFIELFPRLPWIVRIVIQLGLLLYVLSSQLGYEFISGSVGSWDEISHLIDVNGSQLLPYLWFSIVTWISFWVARWWVTAKWRIFLLMIATLLFFAIKDSYSVVVLWPQAAMTIFCGLFLLIIHHFSNLRKKNPVGWSSLAEYPASVAVPIVLLVSLAVFLGTLAPNVSAVLKDPYTIWKNWQGEDVSFFNKGFGNSTIISGDATSGYSRNDSTLGSNFEFDYTPVMTVSTTHRSYWRGETRSLYTGKGWVSSDSEKKAPVSAVTPETNLQLDSRLNTSNLKTVEVTQTVTMLNQEKYPVLFGAFSIDKIQLINNGAITNYSPVQWAARLEELRWDEQSRQAYPETYTIVSNVPIVNEAELRQVQLDTANRSFDEYLYLPDTVPARVKEMALSVTQSGTTLYDKVKLLEKYLSTSFTYTNTPDLSKGKSKDFVDRFLFEIQEGYCDYYSTSMVVLTRALGIPARWVKGYSSGVVESGVEEGLSPELLGVDPDGAGDYTVRNSDAHSWAEVYFAGYGWIPFEPTSGFVLPLLATPEEPVISTEPSLPSDFTPEEVVESSAVSVRLISWISGVTTFVILAGLILFSTRKSWLPLLRARRFSPNLNQRVVLEYERLIRFARRKGYSRSEHETAREMTERWIHKDKWLQNDLESLLKLFEKAKYSKNSITEEEVSTVSRMVSKLRQSM